MERVEVAGGDRVGAGSGKVEIRRGTIFVGFSSKWRLLLLEGREAADEGGSEGLHEAMRKWGMLLLPLKLPRLGF
jgi:hypothetical protein